MPEEEFDHKLQYSPEEYFKTWRYTAWRTSFREWSLNYDATEMRMQGLAKRFDYASRLIQEGRWDEGKI